MKVYKANLFKILFQFLVGCTLIAMAIMINLDYFISILKRFIRKSTIYFVISGCGFIFISIISIFKKKIIINDEKIVVNNLSYLDEIDILDIISIEKIELPKKSFFSFQSFNYQIKTSDNIYNIFSADFSDLDDFYKDIIFLIKNNHAII